MPNNPEENSVKISSAANDGFYETFCPIFSAASLTYSAKRGHAPPALPSVTFPTKPWLAYIVTRTLGVSPSFLSPSPFVETARRTPSGAGGDSALAAPYGCGISTRCCRSTTTVLVCCDRLAHSLASSAVGFGFPAERKRRYSRSATFIVIMFTIAHCAA